MVAKTAILMSDGRTEMSVTEYADMLRGQHKDATDRLIDWEPETVRYAACALPLGCCFELEVLGALKEGRISQRSSDMLERIANEQWLTFERYVADMTGKTLKDFEADDGLFGYKMD